MAIKPQLPKSQYELSTGTAEELNRGQVVSRKDDTVKDLKITLRDIDFAIKYYFQNVIKPQVVEQDKIINVPIIYANPERWKSIQRDGYFKDEKDKVILPIIAFKRNTIAKDDAYAVDKLDANNPMLFYPFKKRWSDKNRYDNFKVQMGLAPTEEYYSVVMPDYVTMTYEFVVMTEAVEQMNKIVEAVIYSEGSYWGEPERFKFRTKIQSYNTNIETSADNIRTVKTTFNMELNGYLVPDTINAKLSTVVGNVQRAFSPKKVVWGFDVDKTSEFFTTTTKEEEYSVARGDAGVIPIQVTTEITDYLAVSITRTATSITTSSATFAGVNILQAPYGSGLTTTKENFAVFVNGQYVHSTFISSMEDDGNNVVITFVTDSTGFSLDLTDILVAVGKFTIL